LPCSKIRVEILVLATIFSAIFGQKSRESADHRNDSAIGQAREAEVAMIFYRPLGSRR
jgi:hypothetical protein